MNKLYFYLFTLLALTTTSTVYSATFCATTSAELQQALDTAAGNNQADIIKIKTGDYIIPPGGFEYEGVNEDHGLEISGGWTPSPLDPCTFHFNNTSVLDTVLDGDSLARVLFIHSGATSDNFKVSNLTFIDGTAENPNAGGLQFLPHGNFSGDFLLERSAFVNNQSNSASALLVLAGINNSKVIIRNNLFFSNNNLNNNYAVVLRNNTGLGIYFTNNTVISNTATATNRGGLGVLLYGSADAYVANNILWNNDTIDMQISDFDNATGTVYAFNNNIGTQQIGAAFQSANNISIPPLFEDGFLAYIPTADSQMLDVGIHPPQIPSPPNFLNAWQLGEIDFLGNPRVQGIKVDMGAFEAPPRPDLIFVDGFE